MIYKASCDPKLVCLPEIIYIFEKIFRPVSKGEEIKKELWVGRERDGTQGSTFE